MFGNTLSTPITPPGGVQLFGTKTKGGSVLKRGLAGALGGQQGIANYDNRQHQQQQLAQKQQAADAKISADKAKQFENMIGDAAAYVRQLPPTPDRTMHAKAYLETRGADPEAIARIEQRGFLNDLTDEKLDAFMSSMRDEQVLKDKEVLLGRDGKPVYENRYNAPQVVADGSALVGDDGQALYTNEKDVTAAKPTAEIQNFEFAKENGFGGSFQDFTTQQKQAGRASTNVNVGAANSAGQDAVDKKYAEDYLAWRQGGGSDNAKLVNQLDSALASLESGRNITDRVYGLLPDQVNSMFRPEATDTRDKVAEVVQRNLRVILCAQFTEKEGKMLMDRAYNPQLDEKVNAGRVRALIGQIQRASKSKEDAAQYFEQHGTLRGWTGKTYSRVDFENAIDSAGGAPSGGSSTAAPANFQQDADGAFVWSGN